MVSVQKRREQNDYPTFAAANTPIKQKNLNNNKSSSQNRKYNVSKAEVVLLVTLLSHILNNFEQFSFKTTNN